MYIFETQKTANWKNNFPKKNNWITSPKHCFREKINLYHYSIYTSTIGVIQLRFEILFYIVFIYFMRDSLGINCKLDFVKVRLFIFYSTCSE